MESEDVVSSDEPKYLSEPKSIECYQGNNILPENMYNAEDCSIVTGMQKVTCQTSCYAYLNSQLRIQLGCDTANICEPQKDLRKIFALLCCQSNSCNCDIHAIRQ